MHGDSDTDGIAGNIPRSASTTGESRRQLVGDAAAQETSPQAVALDLEQALIDAGVDPAEARAAASDFLDHSTAAERLVEVSSEADGGTAQETSPQAVALDLEQALIDAGVDPAEARAAASDYAEHAAPPHVTADDEASSPDAGS